MFLYLSEKGVLSKHLFINVLLYRSRMIYHQRVIYEQITYLLPSWFLLY